MHQSVSERRLRSGWPTFVGLYLLLAGMLNLLWGIAALADKSYFVEGGLLWSSLDLWGGIAVVLGVCQLAGGGLVLGRHESGAIIALGLALLGILANFLTLGAYPWWSVVLIVVNFLIVWAIAVHGEDFVGA